MKTLFSRLISSFGNKEYAHSYMQSHAVTRIAAQIHALRKQRGWSQEELSSQTGIAQETISKIESGNFSSLTMKTLYKFSVAFDVNLQIKFEEFSKGIFDLSNLSNDKLVVESRAEDLSTNCTSDVLIAKNNAESIKVSHNAEKHWASAYRSELKTSQSIVISATFRDTSASNSNISELRAA